MIYPIVTKDNLSDYRLSPYVSFTIEENRLIFMNNLYNTKVVIRIKKAHGIPLVGSLEMGMSITNLRTIIEKITNKNCVDSTIRTLFQQHILE